MPQIPVDQIFQQDPEWLKENYPQIYSNYLQQVGQPAQSLQQSQASTEQTQAAIPGTQAESGIKQVQQQAANYPLSLTKDLNTGLSLQKALAKYSSLMKPDDIFKQFLSVRGMPNLSPTDLQNMGVTPDALGSIGQNGSYSDRWNIKNAIEGIRDLKSKWNNTNALSKLGAFGIDLPTPSGQAYNSAYNILTSHLQSLIPGAAGGEQTAKTLAATLPNIGHISELEPGAANKQFNSVEDQLLKAKGYDYKDLGLNGPETKKDTGTGGALLNGLLKTASNAPKDTANILNSILNIPADVANTEKEIASPSTSPEERLRAINSMSLNSVLGNTILNYGKSLNKDLGEPLQGGNVLGRIINNFEDRPVSTTLDALPFLAAGKASLVGEGSKVADTAEANNINAAAQDVFKGSPNRAQQLLQPGKSKNIIGQIRDRVVANADSSGATISGDKIAGDFRTWADQAKLANIPDAATIEQAAVDAENLYKGKTFTPSELYKTYQKIENGYTTKGAPRTATSAYIDRGTQDILQNALEEKAPGFQKTTQMFSKVYNTEKGTAGKIIKNLPANAVKTGLNLTGLGFLRDILNP